MPSTPAYNNATLGQSIFSTGNKVGILTTSPTQTLHVVGSGLIASGLSVSGSLTLNGTGVSLSGHTHASTDITDFTEAVQDVVGTGFIVAGSGIIVSYNDAGNSFTISSSGGGGGGGITDVVQDTTPQLGGNLDLNSYSVTGVGNVNISGSGLFASGVNIANQTASTIASFDANKNIASLATATYPSLTELSYVKGVTSAIQTQIDSKAATSTTITAGSGLTGGGSLAANRTIDIGQGDGISVTADAIAVDSTVVRTTGTQTVNGAKTFGSASVFVSGLTSSGNILISNQTASTIASFDASKNVVSLDTATYPSLTELSYVKGVTSAVQTQLNNKQATLTNPVTGTGTANYITKWSSTSGLTNSTIFDTGNIGIGTTTPVTKFHIYSNGGGPDGAAIVVQNVGTGGTDTPNLSLNTVSGSITLSQTQAGLTRVVSSMGATSTEAFYVGTSSAHQLILQTSGSPRVYVDTVGRVGIGTASPAATLDVTGSGTFSSSLNVSGVLTATSGVFNSGLTLNDQTASTIAGFDANKKVTTLSTATYPSLTELSYVKGVTSAIQTQLNGKQATLTNPVTGTGTTSYIPRWSSSSALTNSIIYDNGSAVGINTASPAAQLHVVGSGLFASGAVVSGTLSSQILTATTGVITNYAGTIDVPAGGRLTLTSADPFPSGDVTNASTLYYTPYVSNRIALYDTTNTRWQLHTFSEVSFTLTALTSGRNYDVFLYDNAGTKTMQAIAWTNDTTRTTGLATQDGVYVQTGSAGRRYIGTFRTVSTTGTSDSVTNRFVWNMNNRETEILFTNPGYSDNNADTTYTLAGATVTALNGGTGAKTEMVCGLRTVVEAQVRLCGSTTAAGGLTVGIGVDQTGNIDWGVNIRTSEFTRGLSSKRDYILDAGYHHFNLLGINTASTTNTINADYARNFAGTKDLIGTSMSQNYLG